MYIVVKSERSRRAASPTLDGTEVEEKAAAEDGHVHVQQLDNVDAIQRFKLGSIFQL